MTGWLIGGASVRGAAHARSGRPNQDALAWVPRTGAGSRVVGAVSDGHGAALHFRSEIGAALAVDVAAELLAWHLDDQAGDEGEGRLADEILRLWRARVDAHWAAHPEAGHEAGLRRGSPYLPYGATLLVLGATDEQLVMLQIGDGDLLTGSPDGIERPLRADAGLVGEQTYSLCLDDAQRRFRLASLWRAEDRPLPDFALLASDGVSKSFRDDLAFDAATRELRRLALQDWDRVLVALPAWLDDISEHGSGDDSTVCIAVRRPNPNPIDEEIE